MALLVNGLGVVVLAGLGPPLRCLGSWPAAAAAWCVVWSLTAAVWTWRRSGARPLARGLGAVLCGVGCVAAAWLYPQAVFGLVPAEYGGGRPVRETVIVQGEPYRAGVVRLGGRWSVVVTTDCVAVGVETRPTAAPLVIGVGPGRLVHGEGSEEARCASRKGAGDV